MDYKTILIDREEHIATLYLNRPHVLNALCDEMREEFQDFLQDASKDKELRVLIVSGKGRAFCAGADLNVFKERYEAFRREGQKDHPHRFLFPRALAAFPKPIIAAINGPAVGFGATMPLNCDIRIASTKAKFRFAFAPLGVTPEFCSSYFLPRLVGFGRASELVLTARMFDAEEALKIGLVSRVVPPEDLLPEAKKIADQIARLPSGAIQAEKRLLRHGSHSSLDQVLEYEALALQHAMQTQEHYDAVCHVLEEISAQKKDPLEKRYNY